MKQAQYHVKITPDMHHMVNFLSFKEVFEEKMRINLYLPKIVVKILDSLSENQSRGEVVTSLVINEMKKIKKLPYGMFSPIEIARDEIDKISAQWENTVHELA